jgi:hypothetical protein
LVLQVRVLFGEVCSGSRRNSIPLPESPVLAHFALSSSVQESAPVSVRFKCPACSVRDAAGVAHDRSERFKLLHLIPIGTVHSTWVKCSACGVPSLSEIPAVELTHYAPGEVNRFIRRRLPPVLIVLLVAAVPMLLIPGFGLIFSVSALAMAWKYRGWARRVALIEVVLGALLGIAFLVVLALPDTPPAKPTFPPTRQAPHPVGSKP